MARTTNSTSRSETQLLKGNFKSNFKGKTASHLAKKKNAR
jgi:hypothetical protein